MFFLMQKLGFISIFLYSFVFPAIGHSATKWSPQEEPAYWKSVRSRLTSNNLLANDFWTYLESIKNNDVQAAEYLTAMHKQSDTVNFRGALILRRPPSQTWTVRIHSMRALCKQGTLQRQDSAGRWSDYSGRPDTAEKVKWICSHPSLNA